MIRVEGESAAFLEVCFDEVMEVLLVLRCAQMKRGYAGSNKVSTSTKVGNDTSGACSSSEGAGNEAVLLWLPWLEGWGRGGKHIACCCLKGQRMGFPSWRQMHPCAALQECVCG
eukprot:scaffold51380_cov20-Tisochrysis_lutea.AAC.1